MQSNLDKNIPVITLDGPSGTGKGTICHLIANHLQWHILDSGCIYRVLAFLARKKDINLQDASSLQRLAISLDVIFETSPNQQRKIILEGDDVSSIIRSEQCGQDASTIAILPEVRGALLERQRAFAKPPGLVTDGRDMGTVVFPNAFLKIYLEASLEERARRRYLQLKDNEIDVSLAEMVDELAKRDARDIARSHSPLKPAKGAVIFDTTGLTIVQVFNDVLKLIDERLVFMLNH